MKLQQAADESIGLSTDVMLLHAQGDREGAALLLERAHHMPVRFAASRLADIAWQAVMSAAGHDQQRAIEFLRNSLDFADVGARLDLIGKGDRHE